MTDSRYPYRMTFTGVDGKRHDIKAKTKTQLVEKVAAVRKKAKKRPAVKKSDITVQEYGIKIIEKYKVKQKDITREKYLRRMRSCVFQYIGKRKVSSLGPDTLQEIIDKRAGESSTQINETYSFLKLLSTCAYKDGLIDSDICENVTKPPAAVKHKRRALTPEEREAVEKVGCKERRYYAFLLMLYCGCRPSEALSCKRSDVVLIDDKPYLNIRGTKTENARRTVPVPNDFYALIKDIPEDRYIAVNREGRHIGGPSYKRAWHCFKREINLYLGCKTYRNKLMPPFPLPADFKPYNFRHEYCTQLARKGVDIRDAMVLMGHSQISLTANVYTNFSSMESAKRASEALEK